MKVSIELYSTLRPFAPDPSGKAGVELGRGSRIRDLILTLGIPDKTKRVILVNGRVAGEERELAEGDTVVLFPPVEGG
jgi:molybdopterin converting factor small subunit